MSVKTKAGQIWTDSVAYVALLTGAGLSIAGNVANVLRTRGEAADTLDIVLAVAFPALVVLMVEVFVSARWRGLPWPMQVLRWAGTLSIGAVAMRVSWTHLHDLMADRGQSGDVSTLGPLAIDFLAIMATALILAGRGQVEPVQVVHEDTADEILAKRLDEVARLDASTRVVLPELSHQPLTVLPPSDEGRTWLDSLQDSTLDTSTTAAYPISPAPMSNVVKLDSVPNTARDMIQTWLDAPVDTRPAAGQADEMVATVHNVQPRTARRWRDAVKAAA